MTNRTDNFNRADGAIGTPSDGGSDWVLQAGTWTVATNQGRITTSTAQATCTLESSVADVDVQATTTTKGADCGLCMRLSDSSNYVMGTQGPTNWKLYKRVAGTFTQLGSTATGTPADNDVLKLTGNGSSLTWSVNGVSKVTVTDSHNSTQTKHGLRSNSDTTPRFEDFSVTALAGATTHTTTGAITGAGAAVAGSAAHIAIHGTSGALTGPGASVAGSAARTRAHATDGAITGPGSVVAGDADHTAPGVHETTGAIVGPGSTVAGSAAHVAVHGTSGALAGAGAVVAGSAARVAGAVTHATSGALVGPGAVVAGAAIGPNVAGRRFKHYGGKAYLKRDNEVLVFQSEDAKDEFLEAEAQAAQAINRKARRAVIAKQPKPEKINLARVAQDAERMRLESVAALVAKQDYERVMAIQRMIEDEEDNLMMMI